MFKAIKSARIGESQSRAVGWPAFPWVPHGIFVPQVRTPLAWVGFMALQLDFRDHLPTGRIKLGERKHLKYHFLPLASLETRRLGVLYAIKLNSILTTEYTEHTELIRRVFLPCVLCIPWFIQYESS